MGNLMVALLAVPGYGNSLGKKVTSTDITFYDAKKDQDTVTFVEPTRYPEKLAPLFYTVSLANKAIVVVDELNSTFGECAVMLECSGVQSGYIILRNYLVQEKVEPLIKGTILEKFEFVEDDPAVLRERLLKEASQKKTTSPDQIQCAGTVPVDHAFNVKGVGTVVLGVVMKGKVEKHEDMKVLPSEKTAQIRSIQKHDDDFDQAYEGDRVGLALKNVGVEDLDRGTVLTADASIKSTALLEGQASLIRYWPTPLKSGMALHLGHWTQFIPSKVDTIVDKEDKRRPTLRLVLEKELVYLPGDRAVVTYLDGGRLRIVGTIELP